MAFYAIAIASFAKHYGLPVRHPRVETFAKKVFVYGDDIVVPTKEVDIVLDGLTSAGLSVNKNKTFVRSHFRESCGTDAFMGYKVTPVYIRESLPTSKRDASALASAVSTSNQFYKAGYWRTAAFLREIVEKVVGFSLPHVKQESELLGWYSFQGHYSVDRWNSEHHCFQTRSIAMRIRKKPDQLEGYRALAKYFTEKCDESYKSLAKNLVSSGQYRLGLGSSDRITSDRCSHTSSIFSLDTERFAVTSRRGAVYTKLRWASPV
jgi:hypothetical protein